MLQQRFTGYGHFYVFIIVPISWLLGGLIHSNSSDDIHYNDIIVSTMLKIYL